MGSGLAKGLRVMKPRNSVREHYSYHGQDAVNKICYL
jgi:hypothetical protein